jgi:hypothetical protein
LRIDISAADIPFFSLSTSPTQLVAVRCIPKQPSLQWNAQDVPITVEPFGQREITFVLRLPDEADVQFGRSRATVMLVVELGCSLLRLWVSRTFSVTFYKGSEQKLLDPYVAPFVPMRCWDIARLTPTLQETIRVPRELRLTPTLPRSFLTQKRSKRFKEINQALCTRFPSEYLKDAVPLLAMPLETATLPVPNPTSRGDYSLVYQKALEIGKPAMEILSHIHELNRDNDAIFFAMALYLEELQHALDARTHMRPLAQLREASAYGDKGLWTAKLDVPGLMENKPELSIFDMVRLRPSDEGCDAAVSGIGEVQAYVINILHPDSEGRPYAVVLLLPEPPASTFYTRPDARWLTMFEHVYDHFDLMYVL